MARTTAWWTSIGLHALVVAGALTLPSRVARSPKPPGPIDVVVYRTPAKPVAAPRPPAPEAQRRPPQEKRPAVPARPAPRPVEPPPEVARAEPAPPAPAARRPEPVPTQAFAAVPRAAKPEPGRTVARTGAFASDRPTVAGKPKVAIPTASVGTFSQAETTHVRSTASRTAEVQVAGFSFGDAAERVPPAEPDAIVLEASFDVATPAARPVRASAGPVGSAGFGAAIDSARDVPARRRAAEAFEVPVEILSKPLPVYTEQARRLRIEGEVVLEVTFVAGGELRVVRVVRGLGHGLDEAAIAAAKRIEFQPARRDGRPVDHTAQLRVVFRLG
jgi:TonB family protein